MVVKIITITLMAYSIILHEVAHGYAALMLGDGTARRAGRLTLNPLPHIDPFMTILLPMATYLFSTGTFIFGGARPVPVNPFLFRRPRQGMALTAAAGPLTNIALALVCTALLRIRFLAPDGSINQMLFAQLAILNAFLAVFNLIPMPPLDGGRVLVGLLPRNLAYAYAGVERFGIFGVMLVIILLERIGVFNLVSDYIFTAVVWLGGL